VHNSYFVLKQVSEFLGNRLNGYTLTSCFSQQKDELILVFGGKKEDEFYLRADLHSAFSCLSFPEDFSRSHKNTIDLFPSVKGKFVREIRTFLFDRLLLIRFSDRHDMLFKMFGSQSNILLFENNLCTGLFKKNKKADWAVSLPAPESGRDLSFTALKESEFNPGKFIPAFDKNILDYLRSGNYEELDAEGKFKLISETLADLENPESYYVVEDKDEVVFSILKPLNKNFTPFKEINHALNFFYKTRIYNLQLFSEKKTIMTGIKNDIGKAEKYINNAKPKLDAIENKINYKQIADNLMANLSSIKEGSDKIRINDVYTGREIEITLKPYLSIQKNAAVYYRKSKNQDIEINNLKLIIENKNKLIAELKNRLVIIEKIRDLKEFRKILNAGKEDRSGQQKNPGSSFREFTCQGFRILIGKSSSNNEQLTFGEGKKDDLWMHARDVPGSHVLVKQKSGSIYPQPVIERAAELAAYFSKNRNNTLCPVIYTHRKYVRKLKGGAPGQVIVEKEEIIMVRPKL
jgi:predicted ribosome quality control (RQC) complex YloA/Tae2 family protein